MKKYVIGWLYFMAWVVLTFGVVLPTAAHHGFITYMIVFLGWVGATACTIHYIVVEKILK